MEFRQLETLKLIVELGSFSLAAKELGVTQPSVSIQISCLEKELGIILLNRLPSKTGLTEDGKHFYKYALEILLLKDKALTLFAHKQKLKGTISIAASSTPYHFVLPVLGAQFSMAHPDINFNLLGSDSLGALDMVLKGQAQMGMAGTLPSHEDIEFQAILEDELMVLTPAIEPFLSWNKKALSLDNLIKSPFVAREEGSGTWAEVQSFFASLGQNIEELRIVARMDNFDAILKAVEQGLGITILSSLGANEYLRMGNLLAFPLGDNGVKRKIYLFYKKTPKLDQNTQGFVDYVTHSKSTFD